MPPLPRPIAEPVAAHHRPGVDDDAVAQYAVVVQHHARMENGVAAEFAEPADDRAGLDVRVLSDPRPLADHGERADGDAGRKDRRPVDVRGRVDSAGPRVFHQSPVTAAHGRTPRAGDRQAGGAYPDWEAAGKGAPRRGLCTRWKTLARPAPHTRLPDIAA